MIVTVSLWVDQLTNSVIGDLATSLKLYKVTSFLTLAVSLYLAPRFLFIYITILQVVGSMVNDRKLHN